MPAPLAIAAIAAGGFIKGGGLQGLFGGGRRRREEQDALAAQRDAESAYYNFDFNQDVEGINNPYAQYAKQQQEFLQENLDRQGARTVQAYQEANQFGGVQASIIQQNRSAQQNAQQINSLRQQGDLFVESRRQQIIQQRYDQAGTALGRADARLEAARKARIQATESIYKGIGGAATAAAGAATAGPDASFGELLQAGGLTPNTNSGTNTGLSPEQLQALLNLNKQ